MNKAETIAANPDFPWLDANDATGVERLLKQMGFLSPNEAVIACGKAGEGNMNLTLRVRVKRAKGEQSVIVKQSRPWVEKYDFIAAPWDRAATEVRFYERVTDVGGVAEVMPRLLGSDRHSRVLILEDLGQASDLTGIYKGESLDPQMLTSLAHYLSTLHNATRGQGDAALANREMRQLNHAHIYDIPLQAKNGLDLSTIEPALVPATQEICSDARYVSLVHKTGLRYLADGDVLLHGDFFPGSWLRTDAGVRVIDPEFCFFSDAEFDVGVFIAHLALARQTIPIALTLLREYAMPSLDTGLVSRYAACEVMRRLIGYAQLPIAPGPWRAELLRASRKALLESKWELLWA